MDNNDTTLKLLPIDSLQEILFNESTFLNFYNQNNQDYIEDRDSYLKGINDLMVVLMKYDDSLTEEVFHRINAINKKFSVGLIYDYSRYQYKTESLINLNVLRSIIYNDDVYNKFLDFNNNKEFFGNIPLIDYLVSLNNYYDSLKNTHLEIPPGVQSRFAEISRQYTFDNQRANILNGQFIEADLPKSIEKEILSKIDLSDDKFTIARNIYTELNKKCCFDLTFQALHQSMDNPVSKEIYEKDVASVKKGKIIVVCRTWAITYANLLKKCGILS